MNDKAKGIFGLVAIVVVVGIFLNIMKYLGY